MKKILFFIMLLTCFLSYSRSLNTVGVIDTSKVFKAFYNESKAVRELEDKKKEYEQKLNSYLDELRKIENDKIKAKDEQNDTQYNNFVKQSNKMKIFINNFRKVKVAELKKLEENLTKSDEFNLKLYKTIKSIAASSGLTAVFSSNNSDLLWYSTSIDITNRVIKAMR